jgi:hypothetical protein
MNKTNIEEIADKLRIAWNKSTGTNKGQTWEILSEWARQGYIAVAKAAVECAGEKQYRDLELGEVIQPGDEVWEYGKSSWEPVRESAHGKQYVNRYFKMRRPVADCTVKISDLESEDQAKLATCDGSIDWKGHYDSLKRQADAKVAELEQSHALWDEVHAYVHSNNLGIVGKRVAEVVVEELRRKGPLVAKLERIEEATTRLRGFREINSHDPAQCIEDAATMLQKLTFKNHKLQDDWNKDHMEMKRKFDAAENYIEKLEQDLSFYRGVAEAIKGYEEVQ